MYTCAEKHLLLQTLTGSLGFTPDYTRRFSLDNRPIITGYAASVDICCAQKPPWLAILITWSLSFKYKFQPLARSEKLHVHEFTLSVHLTILIYHIPYQHVHRQDTLCYSHRSRRHQRGCFPPGTRPFGWSLRWMCTRCICKFHIVWFAIQKTRLIFNHLV